jgi:hypothetical protein
MPSPLRSAALLAALLAALPAAAQDRPPSHPTRDVTVTYRAPDQGGAVRLSALAAQGLLRIDLPGEQGWMVSDARGGGFLVLPQQRMVMDIAPGQDGTLRHLLPSAAARFQREGSDRVAETPCTVWRVEDRGARARLCITADGIPLRAEPIGRAGGRIEATAVTHAAQDAARFERPAGFARFAMPAGVPGPVPGLTRGTALPPPGLALPPG